MTESSSQLAMSAETQALDFRIRHRFTRIGLHFVFVAMFAMVGGSIRGFNLLLVLSGFLIAALIVQWRCSRAAIESLSAKRIVPAEAFANRPFRVRYRIDNRSRWLSVWMTRVDDHIQATSHSAGKELACGVGIVGAAGHETTYFDCIVNKRGRYRLGPLKLVTAFPFSLIAAQQEFPLADEIYVYPRLFSLRRNWQRNLPSQLGAMVTTARRSGPNEGDFFGIREWQFGDSPRWIHWRTTARTGSPAVRQFEQSRRHSLCILIDGYVSTDPVRRPDNRPLESAVSLAATLVTQLGKHHANRFSLAVAGDITQCARDGHTRDGRSGMMRILAAVQPVSDASLSVALDIVSRRAGQHQDLVVISTRSLRSAMRSQNANHRGQDLQRQLSHWKRNGAVQWVDVTQELDLWVVGQALKPDQRGALHPQLRPSIAGTERGLQADKPIADVPVAESPTAGFNSDHAHSAAPGSAATDSAATDSAATDSAATDSTVNSADRTGDSEGTVENRRG